jgi:hypothetical protein
MPKTEYRRRDEVVTLMRRVGLNEVADDAQLHLPESVSLDEALRFLQERGVSRDVLTDMLGGSP